MKKKRKVLDGDADRECWECFDAIFWEEGSSGDIEWLFVENNNGDYQLRLAPIISSSVLSSNLGRIYLNGCHSKEKIFTNNKGGEAM